MTQFRNYEQLDLSFTKGINCITGNNGAGKTNILEAIHYLALTRGWQRNSEKYALQEETAFFSVEGVLEEERPVSIQCNYMPPKGKKMLVDRKALSRMSDHVGRVPIVTVLPNDTQLIDGGPSVRRKFMDSFISQYDPTYLQRLISYDRALAQRNALLLSFAERGGWDPDQLAMWEQRMSTDGIFLSDARRKFLERYSPEFQRYFGMIVSDKEEPEIVLETQFSENTLEEWEANFLENRNRDRYSHRSSVGIHKDDLRMRINGQTVRHFGSQGQQKTFVIALKMAQYALLAEVKKQAPVLLLDDIFDKLDLLRLQAIAGILDDEVEGQVFITDTSRERTEKVFSQVKNREVKHFYVENGKVSA